MSTDQKEKLEDWEYILGNCIYTTLIGYVQDSGYSIACEDRMIMEKSILKKFRERLIKEKLIITKNNKS